MAVEYSNSPHEAHVFRSHIVVVPNPEIFTGPPSVESAQKGTSVQKGLEKMGVSDAVKLEVAGKLFVVDHEAANRDEATADARQMGEKLLANKTLEVFTVRPAKPVEDAIDTL